MTKRNKISQSIIVCTAWFRYIFTLPKDVFAISITWTVTRWNLQSGASKLTVLMTLP